MLHERLRSVAVVIAVVAAIGCGGSPPPATPAAAPRCAEVADHLVDLAEADSAAPAGPELAAGIRAESVRQCTDTPWSAARRSCLASARTQDDTLACPAE